MVESFHRCGGQDLRESTVKIVHWLLDALCNAPRDHVADSAHGDIGHACGPTSFMTQARIITSCHPWHGAPALMSPTEQKYFQTTTPTAVLDSLRAALVGYPRPLVKLGEALATQSEVSRLLSTHMPGMNENYTAPQVSKQLIHAWRTVDNFDASDVVCGELVETSADQKGGLRYFRKMTPA